MFFTLYQLALYYLLCPYTFDGAIANKVYSIIDTVTYVVLYSTYQIPVNNNVLVYSLLLLAMVIISAGLFWAVSVIAPKHFRIR